MKSQLSLNELAQKLTDQKSLKKDYLNTYKKVIVELFSVEHKFVKKKITFYQR